MSIFVERNLETEVGEIRIAITRAEHISVEGQPEIRGSKFNAHLHFYRQPDGTYDVRDSDRPSMSRAWVNGDSNRKFNEPAPPTYLAKVLAAYRKAVNDHAKAHPEDFAEAEDKDIERDIETATRKVDEARVKLQDAQAELDALYAKQKKHQTAQVQRYAQVSADAAKALVETSAAAWAALTPKEKKALGTMRDRYIQERTSGYMTPQGVRHAPVSKWEAEAMWLKDEPRLRAALKEPDVRRTLQLD